MKQCFGCKVEKDPCLFIKDKSKKDGLYPLCKDCNRNRRGYGKIKRKQSGWEINKNNGYYEWRGIRQHRLIMEENLGRKLLKTEHVHHLNGIKSDNRLENLAILSDSEHHSIHSKVISGLRKNGKIMLCSSCGKEKYLSSALVKKLKKKYECSTCYYKNGGPGGRHKLLGYFSEIDA